MIKLVSRFFILLLSITVFATPFLNSTNVFAVTETGTEIDTESITEVNDNFLSEDVTNLPLDRGNVINLDENPNYVEPPSLLSASCNYSDYSRTSASGSKILLKGDALKYGYCHIRDVHMQLTGLINYSVGDKSQFWGSYTPLGMMNLVMDVIDGTTVLKDTTVSPHRKYKQVYIKGERNDVRVVIHRGSDWTGGSAYDWVVVSAYPVFVPNHAR